MKRLALAFAVMLTALPASAQRPLTRDDIKPNEWMPPQHIEEWCLVYVDNSRIQADLRGIEWHGTSWPIASQSDPGARIASGELKPASQRHEPETGAIFTNKEGVTIPLKAINVLGLIDFRGSLFALSTGMAESPSTLWRVEPTEGQPYAVRVAQISGSPSAWAVAGDDAILFALPGPDQALLPSGAVEPAKARYFCNEKPTEP